MCLKKSYFRVIFSLLGIHSQIIYHIFARECAVAFMPFAISRLNYGGSASAIAGGGQEKRGVARTAHIIHWQLLIASHKQSAVCAPSVQISN